MMLNEEYPFNMNSHQSPNQSIAYKDHADIIWPCSKHCCLDFIKFISMLGFCRAVVLYNCQRPELNTLYLAIYVPNH